MHCAAYSFQNTKRLTKIKHASNALARHCRNLFDYNLYFFLLLVLSTMIETIILVALRIIRSRLGQDIAIAVFEKMTRFQFLHYSSRGKKSEFIKHHQKAGFCAVFVLWHSLIMTSICFNF